MVRAGEKVFLCSDGNTVIVDSGFRGQDGKGYASSTEKISANIRMNLRRKKPPGVIVSHESKFFPHILIAEVVEVNNPVYMELLDVEVLL